jgi:two-component system NarL family sensor kinase
MLDASVAELRGAIGVTHPSVLDRVGLDSALRALAEYHGRRGKLAVSVRVEPGLSARYDRLLFSSARELLTNVVKHARANEVSLSVSKVRGDLVLAVDDDGIGWELGNITALVQQGHYGLAAVVDRIESVDGTLEIQRRERRSGTTAVITVPLSAERAHGGVLRDTDVSVTQPPAP